jgi:hypothetical protein
MATPERLEAFWAIAGLFVALCAAGAAIAGIERVLRQIRNRVLRWTKTKRRSAGDGFRDTV